MINIYIYIYNNVVISFVSNYFRLEYYFQFCSVTRRMIGIIFFFLPPYIFHRRFGVYKIVNRWLDPPRNSIKEGRDTVHLPVIISNARETTLGICSGPYVRQSHARAPNLAQLFTECCCLAWKNNTSDLYGRFSKRPSSHFVLGFRLPVGPWLKIKPHNIWRGKVTGCNKTLEFN